MAAKRRSLKNGVKVDRRRPFGSKPYLPDPAVALLMTQMEHVLQELRVQTVRMAQMQTQIDLLTERGYRFTDARSKRSA